MNQQSKISFTTTPSKPHLNEDQICYQGQLRHNQVMNVKETRCLFVIVCRKLNQTEGSARITKPLQIKVVLPLGEVQLLRLG